MKNLRFKIWLKNIKKINHFKHVLEDGNVWNNTPAFFYCVAYGSDNLNELRFWRYRAWIRYEKSKIQNLT